jgi:hypothetical protein
LTLCHPLCIIVQFIGASEKVNTTPVKRDEPSDHIQVLLSSNPVLIKLAVAQVTLPLMESLQPLSSSIQRNSRANVLLSRLHFHAYVLDFIFFIEFFLSVALFRRKAPIERSGQLALCAVSCTNMHSSCTVIF